MMNTLSQGFGVDQQQQLHVLSNTQDNFNADGDPSLISKDKSNASKMSLKSLSIGGNQAFVDI